MFLNLALIAELLNNSKYFSSPSGKFLTNHAPEMFELAIIILQAKIKIASSLEKVPRTIKGICNIRDPFHPNLRINQFVSNFKWGVI
jgi:hypothetical protein